MDKQKKFQISTPRSNNKIKVGICLGVLVTGTILSIALPLSLCRSKPHTPPEPPVPPVSSWNITNLEEGMDISGWTINFNETKTYGNFYTNNQIELITLSNAYTYIDSSGTAIWKFFSFTTSNETTFYNPSTEAWPNPSFVFPSGSQITSVTDFSSLATDHEDLYNFLTFQTLTPA